ncbi:putative 28S ribosomal protein S26, mitochondrial [Halotydeus destructor]|nr:putative 28S ribosomal protein S26, mitochondrial [Halotydeus destructor]
MNQCIRCQLMPILRATASPCVTQVRWKKREPVKKMKWLPRAPSKLYLVYNKPATSIEEDAQTEHTMKINDSKMKSIRGFFRDRFYLPSLTAGGMSLEQVAAEKDEHLRLLEENEKENVRVAGERVKRLEKERISIREDLLSQEISLQARYEEQTNKARAVLDDEMKRFPTYITKENLELAIEEALANPVNYEYAIDKNGKIYHEGKIHPYALKPNAIPETSSQRDEVTLIGQQELKFEEKKLY